MGEFAEKQREEKGAFERAAESLKSGVQYISNMVSSTKKEEIKQATNLFNNMNESEKGKLALVKELKEKGYVKEPLAVVGENGEITVRCTLTSKGVQEMTLGARGLNKVRPDLNQMPGFEQYGELVSGDRFGVPANAKKVYVVKDDGTLEKYKAPFFG